MIVYSEIVRTASTYVYTMFHQHATNVPLYHNYEHTVDVVSNTEEIAKGMKLTPQQLEVVLIAAWFHDTGYLQTRNNHEEVSASIAARFLTEHHFSEENLKKVTDCIRATKVPQQPTTVLEQVLCDADLLNLGQEDCLEKGEILHKEMGAVSGKNISTKEWVQQSIEFFNRHSYHTDYVSKKYNDCKEKNLKKLERQLLSL